ncbi:hypothetical protein AVEN_132513-1 [Araneus ventricosus]|uniref:Uncharacterized protein n=1 Tax=Araneus ventricosus TaxID=182803 RepID=A0A4Y2T0C7_ARAVE|nr:hypothetical protein AVEN_132513-1 [Araneus ventricosus]
MLEALGTVSYVLLLLFSIITFSTEGLRFYSSNITSNICLLKLDMTDVSSSIASTMVNDTSPVLSIVSDFSSSFSIHNKILVKYPLVPYSIVVFYVLFVQWIGPAIMKKRKPYSLQKVLIVYNLLQAFANLYIAYSAIDGVIRYWDSRCVIRKNPKIHEILEETVGTPTKQYSAILEEVSEKIPAEDESHALYLDGDVTEYTDQETDSETDVEDNPVHEEYSDSNSNPNVCMIHQLFL